jgi:hypothetical protein
MEQENRNATELVSAPVQTFRGLRRFNAVIKQQLCPAYHDPLPQVRLC